MSDRKGHWNRVYETKSPTEVSWHQAIPELSVRLIRNVTTENPASVVDIGGGASTLVDTLLTEGYRDITVLDISERASRIQKSGLGRALMMFTGLSPTSRHGRRRGRGTSGMTVPSSTF